MSKILHPIDRVLGLLAARGLSETKFLFDAGLAPAIFRNARDKQGVERANALSLPTLRIMAEALGVSIGQLLGEAAAIARADEAARTASGVAAVPLSTIAPSLLNPRKTFDLESLNELADSIAAQGLLQNLVLRPAAQDGRYEIVAGERRFRALELLVKRGDIDADFPVPAKILPLNRSEDGAHLATALLENLQRRDMNPLEEAEAFQALQALDPKLWSAPKIAKAIGFTERYVQQRLAVAKKLSDDAKLALRDGAITISQARVIVQAPAEAHADLLDRAKGGKYRMPASVQALAEEITGDMFPFDRAIFDTARCKLETAEIEGKLYFTDGDAASAAQKKAAEAKAKTLRESGNFRWVQFIDGHYDKSKFAKAKPGEKAGCVVHLDYDGEVKTIGQLAKKAGAAENEKAERADRDAKQAEREKQAEAEKSVAKKLNLAFGSKLLAVHRLWLFDGLTDAPLFEFNAVPPPAMCTVLGLDKLLSPAGNLKPGCEAAAWKIISALGKDDLLNALNDMIRADPLRLRGWGDDKLHPTAKIALALYNIEPPAHLVPDQTEIEAAALNADIAEQAANGAKAGRKKAA